MPTRKLKTKEVATLLSAAAKKNKPWRTYLSAVILAGGSGTRAAMGDGLSKQMRPVGGVPMIVRTVRAFEECEWVDEIIIVARKEEIGAYSVFKERYNLKKIAAVVPGGDTRQESAMEGLKAISELATLIAIHDGARPLVTDKIIREVAHLARTRGAASAACKCVDTPKIIDATGKTDPNGKLDRDRVYLMQTPQIFRVELYRAAAYVAKEQGFTGTDDCSLLENIGFACRLIDCGGENIKVTCPADFMIAEAILASRKLSANVGSNAVNGTEATK